MKIESVIREFTNYPFLIHQIKNKIDVEEHEGIKFIMIDSKWSPKLGHVYISGSGYPVDFNGSDKFIIGTNVINVHNNNRMFDVHKSHIIRFLLNNIDRIKNGQFLNEKFDFKYKKMHLVNFMSMTELIK